MCRHDVIYWDGGICVHSPLAVRDRAGTKWSRPPTAVIDTAALSHRRYTQTPPAKPPLIFTLTTIRE